MAYANKDIRCIALANMAVFAFGNAVFRVGCVSPIDDKILHHIYLPQKTTVFCGYKQDKSC